MATMLRMTGLVCSLLVIAACGSFPNLPGFSGPGKQLVAVLPASFRGTLPCRDCAGVDYLLQLRPDGTYFQRQTFPSGSGSDDAGSWFISSDGEQLVLEGNRDVHDRFRIGGADELIKLSATGLAAGQPQRYALRRISDAPPLQPQLELQGQYVLAGGQRRFDECRTGLTLTVLPGGQSDALDNAYLDDRHAMGEPLLVTLVGRLSTDPDNQSSVAAQVLRFVATYPGVSCPPRSASVAMEGTRWQLVRLNGQAVSTPYGEVGPHIELEGRRLSGSTGCDELSGRYRLSGNHVEFDQLATTNNACPGDAVLQMMFTDVLEKVRRWRTLGDDLELYDVSGTAVARLRALK